MGKVKALSQGEVSPHAEVMTVTPALAEKWLEGNVHNRPLKQTVVDRYTREMKAGGWKLSQDAIAFSPNNVLLNGQHRLWAVIESDKELDFLVAWDMDPDSQMVMDVGVHRNDADRYSLDDDFGMKVTKQHVACARKIVGWDRVRRWTDIEQRRFLKRHYGAIDFAVHQLSGGPKGVKATVTMAVVARAFYTVEQESLERFCKILKSGMYDSGIGGEYTAVLLGRFLIENSVKGSGFETEKYSKISRALQAFLEGEDLRKLYGTTNEIFPLPEEQPAKKTKARSRH